MDSGSDERVGGVMHHLNEESAKESAAQAVSDVVSPWMVAVFQVVGDKILMNRTTFEFPRKAFDSAVEALKLDLSKEMQTTRDTMPLPEANPKIVSWEEGGEQ